MDNLEVPSVVGLVVAAEALVAEPVRGAVVDALIGFRAAPATARAAVAEMMPKPEMPEERLPELAAVLKYNAPEAVVLSTAWAISPS